MTRPALLAIEPLGFPWQTTDPFLVCVHHVDDYPAGDARLAPPTASLAGRRIGNDFAGIDGWRMYHGDVVPGFPGHPHRGFETVTLVRRGFIDHSDSLGATARFGAGDLQWLTAGGGIVHSEMFPLLRRDAGNPLELFQIWLNLPRANKLVPPHFSMLWRETIPVRIFEDGAGRRTTVTIVAGALGDTPPPAPPPHSWAADPRADVAIWTLALDAGAEWTLPAAAAGCERTLYYFAGNALTVAGKSVTGNVALRLDPTVAVPLVNGAEPSQLILLQGRPLAEPVAQHGPFVMSTRAELEQAFDDFQRTRFGGWPWPSDGPVHAAERGRFALHPDGRIDEPQTK